jgi:hypothetical protein
MARIKLPADGQEFDLEDEIAKDDETLRRALSPVYPDAANATFTRKTEGGVMTVTVAKRAGTKGGAADALLAAPEYASGTSRVEAKLAAMRERGPVTFAEIRAMGGEIEKAVAEDRGGWQAVRQALRSLSDAAPQASSSVPTGF